MKYVWKTMVEVNETLTRQVAHLARLELSDEEVKTFTSQLSNIIKYVEKLQEADVSNTEPMTHPLEMEAHMREDEVQPSPVDSENKPKVLNSAPDVLYEGFKVPQII
jgi:aspartyl-tRNA(Asn)/glutamyl-tRNA(Gln) amidotransferase subunit C